MRKDIELHIETGDVAIDPQNSPRMRDFRWVNEPSLLSSTPFLHVVKKTSYLSADENTPSGI